MDAKDFRRIALSLDGVEEGSHMGALDFRVGGRISATHLGRSHNQHIRWERNAVTNHSCSTISRNGHGKQSAGRAGEGGHPSRL